MPSSQAVLGPGQVQGLFRSTPDIAREISLLDQRGSEVKYGNLLTLPVGGGLLYVEPLYVQAQGLPFPTLQFVLVAFGNRTAYAPTLAEALDRALRRGSRRAGAGPGHHPDADPARGRRPAARPRRPPTAAGGGTQSPALTRRARTSCPPRSDDLQAAYRSGDVARIGAGADRRQPGRGRGGGGRGGG